MARAAARGRTRREAPPRSRSLRLCRRLRPHVLANLCPRLAPVHGVRWPEAKARKARPPSTAKDRALMAENEGKAWTKAWSGPKAIGAYVAHMLDPVARARGFATTALFSEWPAVVGAELARFTMPDKVLWPRKFEDREAPGTPGTQSAWRVEGATLVLKVDGPRAIEVQHRAAPDPGAGQHPFRLSGHRPIALPAGAGEPSGERRPRPSSAGRRGGLAVLRDHRQSGPETRSDAARRQPPRQRVRGLERLPLFSLLP